MVRILLADDHTVVREGVKRILQDIPDLEVADEATTGQEVLAWAETNTCDVVLLDISLPGANGLETLKQLRRKQTMLPVLMFSVHPEEQYAVRALKAGASGYLTKGCEPHELIAALRKVAQGGKYISATLAERLVDEVAMDSSKLPHEHLSDREYQVLCMLASGKSATEIADILSLSVKTISTHRARILRKMQMKTNAELIHYALQQGLID
jgi:DNA-binding NarL/FixJ family response regulator